MKHLFFLILLLYSCSRHSKSAPKIDDIARINTGIKSIRPLLPTCEFEGVKYACKGNNDDGDSTKWMGLLCFSGELAQCEALGHTVDQDGRLWRSPGRVGNDTEPTSSRDMFLGFLAGYERIQDRIPSALSYAKNNGLCGVWNTCRLTPLLQDLALKLVGKESFIDDATLVTQAQTVPVGYELELQVNIALLRRSSGTGNKLTEKVFEIANSRDSENLYFQWALKGTTQELIDEWTRRAGLFKRSGFSKTQWQWERDSRGDARNHSMGWDLVFLGNLMMQ